MKKVLLIAIPGVIIATVVALGLMGVIRIPGLSPTKSKAKAAQAYSESPDQKIAKADDKTVPEKPANTQKAASPKVAVATEKPELGQNKLAKLWNELEPAALVAVSKDWKTTELAPILMKMDSGKVAQFLTLLDPKRASSLSRELQKVASVVPPETGT